MSAFECEFEYSFDDYREKIQVSDKDVYCCESGVKIPAGTPYVLCQGICEALENEWQDYPQCIHVWRYLRNTKQREGSCFSFQGVEEELSNADFGDDAAMFVKLGFYKAVKRAENVKSIRLHPWEKAAMESGAWYEWIQFPSGGLVFKLSEDGTRRDPVPPSTFAGQPWIERDKEDTHEQS